MGLLLFICICSRYFNQVRCSTKIWAMFMLFIEGLLYILIFWELFCNIACYKALAVSCQNMLIPFTYKPIVANWETSGIWMEAPTSGSLNGG
jgi:hypothetical protein